LAEFAINNKVHLAMKVSLFMANYGRELRMGADIRKKEKVEKATEFVKKKGDRVMLSIKDFVFKKRLVKKPVD